MPLEQVDFSRLQVLLNNSRLQTTNNPLYELIHQLLKKTQQLQSNASTAIDSSSSGSVVNNQTIIQQLLLGDSDNSDSSIIPGPKGDTGSAGPASQSIFLSETIEGESVLIPGPTGATGATGAAGAGKVAQVISSEVTTVATGTTTIPVDNTIPQNTEGTQFLTATITPTNINSILVINVSVQLASHTATRYLTAALFQDTTANALAAATFWQQVVDGSNVVSFTHVMTAGTIAATTFKIRAGTDNAATITLNGANGVQFFGGVMSSTLVITEITP